MPESVSAADLAELAVALLGLVVDADAALALGDLHRLRFPEAERVDRRGRPAPARRAMTETPERQRNLDTEQRPPCC